MQWARGGRIGFYGELVDQLGLLDWPEGAYTNHGSQVGKLLGDVSVAECLDDRPLLSALVIGREEGMPGTGFFGLCEKLLGTHVGKSDEAKLAVWSKEAKRCHEFWRRR